MRQRGRILLIALPVVVLLAGGAAAFFFLHGGRVSKGGEQADVSHQLSLADLVVNLADEERAHYLTASVTLVITGPDPEKTVAARDAQIRDAVLMAMSKHSYRDLISADGKAALKTDLQEAVEEALSEDRLRVTEVLFTNFVMD